MTRLTVLAFLMLTFGLVAELPAQMKDGDVTTLIQASGSITDLDDRYHELSRDIKQNTGSRVSSYYVSISPTWWLGEHTAIELEFGYRWMSATLSCVEGTCYQKLSTALLIPHVLLSFAALDSVLIPYVKGGVGFYSAEQASIPLCFSFGAGAMYFATQRLFFRGEVNFRGSYSEGPSHHYLTSYGWFELALLIGIGWRI